MRIRWMFQGQPAPLKGWPLLTHILQTDIDPRKHSRVVALVRLQTAQNRASMPWMQFAIPIP